MAVKGRRKGTKMQTYYVVLEAGGWKGTFKTNKEALQKLQSRKKFLKSKNNSDWKLLSIKKIKRKIGSR